MDKKERVRRERERERERERRERGRERERGYIGLVKLMVYFSKYFNAIMQSVMCTFM